jgi:ankyrin repeat protein
VEVKAALSQHGAKRSLLHAAEKGMRELVADLIKEGADAKGRNHRGWTSLRTASFYGHAVVVQTLWEHGADVAARDKAGKPSLDRANNEEGQGCPCQAMNTKLQRIESLSPR